MKKKGTTLLMLCFLLSVPVTAGAVDIQAVPIVRDKPSSVEKDKQNYNIGLIEPQNEKALEVWLNFYESKKMSIGCGLSLQPQELHMHRNQGGNSVGLDSVAEAVQGCVGFKYSFR